ncbi:hypothetical protein GCM10010464_17030 [Pseudonocardia yunnanensis]|uniref:Integral membrane protein n=1 Tax=Pseudonocardia yunnanensis TaxID=58107 RepID=A0ABW4ERH5_9PSEU
MTALPLPIATTSDGGRLLRFALRLDAAGSGALSVVGLAAAPLLTDLLGISEDVLRGTGAFFVAYAVALVVLAAMRTIPRPAAWTVVVGNLAWSAGSIAAVVAARESLTALGMGVVLVQAAAVVVFAELQWMGLRRAR